MDLDRYTRTRAAHDPEFAEGLERGDVDFKVRALLRQAREEAGLIQEELRPIPAGKKVRDLSRLLAALPHLSEEEAALFADDVEQAREKQPKEPP
jgi:hypothetical protein